MTAGCRQQEVGMLISMISQFISAAAEPFETEKCPNNPVRGILGFRQIFPDVKDVPECTTDTGAVPCGRVKARFIPRDGLLRIFLLDQISIKIAGFLIFFHDGIFFNSDFSPQNIFSGFLTRFLSGKFNPNSLNDDSHKLIFLIQTHKNVF